MNCTVCSLNYDWPLKLLHSLCNCELWQKVISLHWEKLTELEFWWHKLFSISSNKKLKKWCFLLAHKLKVWHEWDSPIKVNEPIGFNSSFILTTWFKGGWVGVLPFFAWTYVILSKLWCSSFWWQFSWFACRFRSKLDTF